VSFPATARFTHVLLVYRLQRSPAVGVDDAVFVDHFEAEDDHAGGLNDVDAVVVAIRHHRRRHATRDAAIPAVEVLWSIPGLQLQIAARRGNVCCFTRRSPAALHQRGPALAFGCELRQFSVWRIDDHRGLTLRERRIARAALERGSDISCRERLRRGITGLAHAKGPIDFSLVRLGRLEERRVVGIARRRRWCSRRRCASWTATSRATSTRTRAHEVQTMSDRPDAGEVGITPRGTWVDPALGCFDEMVGLAWCHARRWRKIRCLSAGRGHKQAGGARAKHHATCCLRYEVHE
jgi:hypothetical protein